MNVQDSVRQAIAAGAIAPSTVQPIKQAAGRSDARALQILEDATDDGTIKITTGSAS